MVNRFTIVENDFNKRHFALRASLQRHICFRKLHLQYTNTAAFAFCASAPLVACEKSGLSIMSRNLHCSFFCLLAIP